MYDVQNVQTYEHESAWCNIAFLLPHWSKEWEEPEKRVFAQKASKSVNLHQIFSGSHLLRGFTR